MERLLQKLEEIKPLFLKQLDYQLFIYTTIGSGTYESPMWIQMDSIWADLDLKFVNSQRTSTAFYVPVDKQTQRLIRDYRDEAYDFFKYAKYMYIKEVAPTVWQELAQGHNGTRINNFLNSYKTVA